MHFMYSVFCAVNSFMYPFVYRSRVDQYVHHMHVCVRVYKVDNYIPHIHVCACVCKADQDVHHIHVYVYMYNKYYVDCIHVLCGRM